MKSKYLIITGAIFLVIALYYYIGEVKVGKIISERKELGKKVFPVSKKDDIKQISIVRSTETIIIEKVENEWRIKEPPINAKVDKYWIEGVLSSIVGAEVDRKVEDMDRAECGLEPGKERLKVRLTLTKKPTECVVYFGDENPLDTHVYFMRGSGKDIMLAPKYLFADLNKAVFDIRDKSIIDFDYFDVVKLSIMKDGKETTFEKSQAPDDKNWYIVGNRNIRYKRDKIEDFLIKIKNWRVAEFVEEKATAGNLHKFGFNNVKNKVCVWTGKNMASMGVLFGRESDNNRVFAKRDTLDDVYLLSKDVLKDLPDRFDDWVNKRMLDFYSYDIKKLEILQKDKPKLVIEEKDGKKVLVEPKDKKLDNLDTIIYRASEVEYENIADENKNNIEEYNLSSPMLTLTFYTKNNITETLKVSKVADKYFCIAQRLPFIYQVPKSWVEQLESLLK
jgi:hypothetical protein